MSNLFEESGAEFSTCRKYRYALWRIWDKGKPFVMFIGLNPSTANENDSDNTITKVKKIAMHNGYGAVYMMNCFPYVSTDPAQMVLCQPKTLEWNINSIWLLEVSKVCKDVVFAWGAFPIVSEMGRDKDMINTFPKAKALFINKNGSPKHPLYCKDESRLIDFKS